MFITDVNTASKQGVKSVRMHETARRLHEAARKMKGATTLTSVANLLGETVQTVKNWEARGVSQGGQVKARERIGCDTHWLATGEGPMSAAHPPPTTHPARSARAFFRLRTADARLGGWKVVGVFPWGEK